MQVRIREAKESDVTAILAIYRSSGLDRAASFEPQEAQTRFKRMASYPSYRLYIAEDESGPVGTFALLIMDNLANGGLPSGIIEDIAVAAEAQGKGIGKAMMQFALDECRRQGCYKMVLSSNEKRVAAHRFYESLGLTRHGFSYLVELKPE